MSFLLPKNSGIDRNTITLTAFSQTDIQVKYRDTSGVDSGVKTVTANSLKFDLTNGFNEQILNNSVRFKLGTDVVIDRAGTLYRNINPSNGSGTLSGSIQYGTGIAQLDSWTPNIDNQLTLESLVTTTDIQPINQIAFRAPVVPMRPQSLSIIVSTLNSGQLTLTADENGVIENPKAHGSVNYENGFIELFFYVKTVLDSNNRPSIEAEPWYDPSLEYTESSTTYINVPEWVTSDIRYSAVSYTYIPLDKDLLGLSATRLPLDGRVPVFRIGDVGFISAEKTQELDNYIAGSIHQLDDVRISYCELEDSNGTKVDYELYTVDYDYGKVILGGDFVLANLVAPLVARYRYHDMAVISGVQIDGQVNFNKPVTHNYSVSDSIAGSALMIGDMYARYTRKFVQGTWSNLWEDEATGSTISANYNDAIYPIELTNKGAIDERWALVFTDQQNFRIIGETTGQIGTGNINNNCFPINPITGAPYFKILANGWGAGWVNGNVLRFNTVSAMKPIWCVRTVKQSEPTAMSDEFQIMFRGDIDRDI